MSNSSTRFLEGLLLGGILGFLGGILFAPKSGKELRRELAEGSDELYKNASTGISDFKDRGQQAVQDLQSRGDAAIKQATAQFQETRDQLSQKLQELGGKSGKIGVQEPESAQHM
ncbi:MAG: YtxH domain-containing protein [Candidatus Obscuribacterales bacterium]|jgi:gas vesicle protein|nr:YtxH domain-containing protein [Candidatus Obscuribacterales bacterium]